MKRELLTLVKLAKMLNELILSKKPYKFRVITKTATFFFKKEKNDS